jgi:hypothetical protein
MCLSRDAILGFLGQLHRCGCTEIKEEIVLDFDEKRIEGRQLNCASTHLLIQRE